MKKALKQNSSLSAIDTRTFETLSPSRYITFTFPNPNPSYSKESLLRVAVLDSPVQNSDPPRVAAMLVPENRECDWIFSTESGHLQLLLLLSSPGISRLVLIGKLPITRNFPPLIYNRPNYNDEYTIYIEKFQNALLPLLIALSPKPFANDGLFDIPFVSYEDNVKHSILLEKCCGSFVGQMLVEDVEIENSLGFKGSNQEFRRRLRFKRMPNLIQTEIRIVPVKGFGLDSSEIGKAEFEPDLRVLVHSYLAPMVAGLSLIGDYIEEKINCGVRPKALCIGVGGGALIEFMRTRLGFEVVGVEMDEEVLRVARKYFGLIDDEFIRIGAGDGIQMLEEFSTRGIKWKLRSLTGNEVGIDVNIDKSDVLDAKFDVIMVDLDSSDVGNGIVAPPVEFMRKPVLSNAKLALCNFGILVVNVIPPNKTSYETLIHEFHEIFGELYEIEVGNEENYVLIASASPIGNSSAQCENSFMETLKLAVSKEYMNSIRKL